MSQHARVTSHLQIKDHLVVVHRRFMKPKLKKHAFYLTALFVVGRKPQELIGCNAIGEMIVQKVLCGQI